MFDIFLQIWRHRDVHLTLYNTIILKKSLSKCPQNTKALEENMGEYIYNLGIGRPLKRGIKLKGMKENTKKFHY